MSGKAIHDDMLARPLHWTTMLQRSEKIASQVQTWEKQCRGTEDEYRSGRPKDAASTENVQIVNDMFKDDRRLTIQHIPEITDIHATTVYRIVSDDLRIKKVSARWVPRINGGTEAKSCHVCTGLLCHLQPQIFLDRIVTQDETWVHHFDPKRKRQSMVCLETPVLLPLRNSW